MAASCARRAARAASVALWCMDANACDILAQLLECTASCGGSAAPFKRLQGESRYSHLSLESTRRLRCGSSSSATPVLSAGPSRRGRRVLVLVSVRARAPSSVTKTFIRMMRTRARGYIRTPLARRPSRSCTTTAAPDRQVRGTGGAGDRDESHAAAVRPARESYLGRR